MSSTTVIFDFCNYLSKVCPLLLGYDGVPSPNTDDFQEEIQRFVSEAEVSTIYVALTKEISDNGLDVFKYQISTAAIRGSSSTTSMAFLKQKAAPLSANSPLQNQLRVIELGGSLATSIEEKEEDRSLDESVLDTEEETRAVSRNVSGDSDSFEVLYGYLHHMFAPLLQSYVLKLQQNSNGEPNNTESKEFTSAGLKQSLPILGKRIQELEYALKTCMQQTEIPEVTFNIEAEINAFVAREETEGHLTMEELGIDSLQEDSALLKRLKKVLTDGMKIQNNWHHYLETSVADLQSKK